MSCCDSCPTFSVPGFARHAERPPATSGERPDAYPAPVWDWREAAEVAAVAAAHEGAGLRLLPGGGVAVATQAPQAISLMAGYLRKAPQAPASYLCDQIPTTWGARNICKAAVAGKDLADVCSRLPGELVSVAALIGVDLNAACRRAMEAAAEAAREKLPEPPPPPSVETPSIMPWLLAGGALVAALS